MSVLKFNQIYVLIYKTVSFLFFTCFWVPHGQIWAIIEGIASLILCQSLRFDIFPPEVLRGPRYEMGPKARPNV